MEEKEKRYIIPEVDIYEKEDEFVVKAEMPGVEKENVDIDVADGKLVLTGELPEEYSKIGEESELTYQEFALANYKRTFEVGNSVDTDKISAKMDAGILTLNLPKSEKIKPKKIQITAE